MITLNTNPGLLRTAVYERILSDLQQGAIAPGETISLNKLAETLNISKTPLRDALLELQAEGFVTLYPQRGVMVNALSEEEKREIYEVCGVLDGQVIRNVFPRVTPEHVARLKDLNARIGQKACRFAFCDQIFEQVLTLTVAVLRCVTPVLNCKLGDGVPFVFRGCHGDESFK